ncbi:YncE family protein [Kangiella sp. M94]
MFKLVITLIIMVLGAYSSTSQGEILALINYESKPADSLKSLKLSGTQQREEGIAVMDVDPKSDAFGKILIDIPLPADLVAHHIFYDKKMTKAYITALGKSELRVMDLNQFPYRLKLIELDNCKMGEDVVFSADNSKWYLTCMGSDNVYVGDTKTDKVLDEIKMPQPYPHGIAINNDIDRILVTSTVSPDMTKAGDYISVIEASTHKVMKSIKVSNKDGPAGEAPVEVLFVPNSNPVVAYVTNMQGGTLWTLTWDEKKKDFDAAEVFDFSTEGAGVPLEIYFSDDANTLYVSTAKPGKVHVFDISKNSAKPNLVKTYVTAEGAHHIAFTKDGSLGFVQNSFLNLPGMSDGEITVVDMASNEVTHRIDTFKANGFNPNSIVLLPEWNHLAGH